jgi:hypothetical protein
MCLPTKKEMLASGKGFDIGLTLCRLTYGSLDGAFDRLVVSLARRRKSNEKDSRKLSFALDTFFVFLLAFFVFARTIHPTIIIIIGRRRRSISLTGTGRCGI